jgi:hypothetical protein
MTARTANLAVLTLGAVSLGALTALGSWALWTYNHDWVVWVMLIEAVIYAAVAWHSWHTEEAQDAAGRRRALAIILTTAALARLLLIFAPPLSTDIYRYVWDGRVAAAGINPYRYRPADPEVAFLRDRTIFPRINRAASAVTIYPPVAQAIFLAVTRLSQRVTAMKAAMVGFEAVSIATLLALLRRRGLPSTRVLLYAWHPLPLFEFAGSGHIDAAAIALMLLACLFADRLQPLAAGALLAAAVLVKFFPAVIAPALYRRWNWRFPAALLVVVIALYLPYLGVGREVLGFLPAYLHEENLSSGTGFFLLSAIAAWVPLPGWADPAYVLAGLAVLASAGAAVLLRRGAVAVPLRSGSATLPAPRKATTVPLPRDAAAVSLPRDTAAVPLPSNAAALPLPHDDESLTLPRDAGTSVLPRYGYAAAVPLGSALLLLALFTVLLSPHLAWYFAWTIPFLCFRPSWAWIYLSGAAPLLYAIIWAPGLLKLQAALYLPFVLILIVETIVRLRMPRLEAPNDQQSLESRRAG